MNLTPADLALLENAAADLDGIAAHRICRARSPRADGTEKNGIRMKASALLKLIGTGLAYKNVTKAKLCGKEGEV